MEPDEIEPSGSFTTEPPEFRQAPPHHLTPMGEVEQYGQLARRIGPDRLRQLIVLLIVIMAAGLILSLL